MNSLPGGGRRGLGELGLDRGQIEQAAAGTIMVSVTLRLLRLTAISISRSWSFWAAGSLGVLNEPMVTRLE